MGRRDNVQNTQHEYHGEGRLLHLGDLQLLDQRHGYAENDEVRGDGIAGVGVPEFPVVDTDSVDASIPGPLDGMALENRNYDRGDAVEVDNENQTDAGPSEPLDLIEDSQVEKQDGGLGEVDTGLVDVL